MWKGLVLTALLDMYRKYYPSGLRVVRKPDVMVLTTKMIAKNSLQLVPLSRYVGTCSLTSLPHGALSLGVLWKKSECDQVGWVKSSTVWPDPDKPKLTPHVVPYWAVESTHDPTEVNCEKRVVRVPISCCEQTRTIEVPVIVNTVALSHGARLFVKSEVKRAAPVLDPAAPPAKAARTTEGAKGTGKGKGKGKGKGNRKN